MKSSTSCWVGGEQPTLDTLIAAAIATLIAGYLVSDTGISRRIARFEEQRELRIVDPEREVALEKLVGYIRKARPQ